MHTTCTRTTATTASGCHPSSTVLVGANNNNNVVGAEGSLTHSARYGLTSVWRRRHRTHSTIIHARISSLTHTNTQKWEGDSVKQRPHAGITDHYTPQQRCITAASHAEQIKIACLMEYSRNSHSTKEP
ncbi:exo-alpha-sialidase [Trypanosoma cruzi]|nr:exo-alpha-sialidase [Trypanosoma cruzi]